MEQIGNQKIWSFLENGTECEAVSNTAIRGSGGHLVETYFQLAQKVAELQFRNRDFVLLHRGQSHDFRTKKRNSLLKASIFRNEGDRAPTSNLLQKRFETLVVAEKLLADVYEKAGLLGHDRVRRHRIIRWAILQHYEVCPTPLLDVTHSLRIAASFATLNHTGDFAYLFVFAVPNLSGAITASSEAGMQIVRLSSACPPSAVRAHLQEGYLLGEYPEIADTDQNNKYQLFEMDFGRRLVAKFRLNLSTFWHRNNYTPVPAQALLPSDHRDPLLSITAQVKSAIATNKS